MPGLLGLVALCRAHGRLGRLLTGAQRVDPGRDCPALPLCARQLRPFTDQSLFTVNQSRDLGLVTGQHLFRTGEFLFDLGPSVAQLAGRSQALLRRHRLVERVSRRDQLVVAGGQRPVGALGLFELLGELLAHRVALLHLVCDLAEG